MTHLYCLWYKYIDQELLRCLTCTIHFSPVSNYNVFDVISLKKKMKYEPTKEAVNLCFVDCNDKNNYDFECEAMVRGNFNDKRSLCNCKNYKSAIESYALYGKIYANVKVYKENEIFQTNQLFVEKIFTRKNSVKINTHYPIVKKASQAIISCTCPYIAFVTAICQNGYSQNAYNLAKLYIECRMKKRPFILFLISFLVTDRGANSDWFYDIIDDHTFYAHCDTWEYLNKTYPGVYARLKPENNTCILRICHPNLAPAVVITNENNPKNLDMLKSLSFPNQMVQQFMERLFEGGEWIGKVERSNILNNKTINSLLFYSTLYEYSRETDEEEIASRTLSFFTMLKQCDVRDYGVLLPSFNETQQQPVYRFFPLHTCIIHLNSFQDLLSGFFKLFDCYARNGSLKCFIVKSV